MAMEFQLSGPKALATFVPLPEEEENITDPGTYNATPGEGSTGSESDDPAMGLTENKAATFLTSGSRCLDFFFQIVPTDGSRYSPSHEPVKDLLSEAWKEDPLLALKLVFQLRGVRGTGKSDKLNFYEAACWLYDHHPATFAANIPKIPKAGYYKDLLELLRRILEGPEKTKEREREKATHKSKREAGKHRRHQSEAKRKYKQFMEEQKNKAADTQEKKDEDVEDTTAVEGDVEGHEIDMAKKSSDNASKDDAEKVQGDVEGGERDMAEESSDNASEDDAEDVDDTDAFKSVPRRFRRRPGEKNGYFYRKGAAARAAKKDGTLKPREERIAESLVKGKAAKEAAAVLRKDKHLKLAKKVVEKHRNEPKFAAVYNGVAELFAKDLIKDLEALNKDGRKARISLAAKWCPSLDSSYDRDTLLCEAIACMAFPKSTPEFAALDHHHYVSIVRDKLRKEVLVPLRKALELPEVYMAAQAWHSLPYRRVASVAMKRYKELFIKHDEERFKQYLDKVESGKTKIAAGALLPYEILLDAVKESEGEGARVAELQWRTMVEEMKQKGCLSSSLAICDVSASMSGTPMDVCIALGMLTAELNDEPWKGKVITFSDNPMLHTIKGETLQEKYKFTIAMEWGANTDFQKVFDLILELAQQSNLPPNRMIQRLFVFSDMEFDEARDPYYHGNESPQPWDTDYMQICRKFREAGYGSPPQIVFWNLRYSKSIPVSKDQPGVALVSGFSKNMLKMFMENNGEIDPMIILKQAIADDFYDELVVVD